MINEIIEKTASIRHEHPSDYKDKDGYLVCHKCHKRKEMDIEYPKGSKRYKRVFITCDCDKEEQLRLKQQKAKQQHEQMLQKLYAQGLTDEAYRKNTFDIDDNRNEEITRLCKQYVKNFDKLKKEGYGIIFYGDTGGGKSFYSCCIANALIHKGVRVLVSRLSDLVKNRTSGKQDSPVNVKNFDLLVLDDIGAENYTPTAYNIIDDIYRSNIPLIVTTNLAPSMMKKPKTIEQKRIYDRVIERCCITAKVDVRKTRLDMSHKNREQAMAIMGLT